MFWARVKEHLTDLKVLCGDWTDYWNFGCISSARETTIARTTRSRLYRADALFAVLSSAVYRDTAWHALNLYGEHTWGADNALGLGWYGCVRNAPRQTVTLALS